MTVCGIGHGVGYGWDHPFNYRMDVTSVYMRLHTPKNGSATYGINYSGQFIVPEGAPPLEETGDGYRVELKDGTIAEFGPKGAPTLATLPNGDQLHFTATEDGRYAASVTDGVSTFYFEYDGDDNLVAVRDNAGRSVSYRYEDGSLTESVNADGDSVFYAYDEKHNPTKITDFNDNLYLTNAYDEKHRVLEQYMPDRGNIVFTYDEASRTNRYEDENGLFNELEMDEKNRVIRQTTPDGTETFTYDEQDRITQKTDCKGGEWAYTYAGDSDRDIASITHPDGRTEEMEYNGRNQVTRKTQRDGTVVTYAYDGEGNVTQERDAKGGTHTYERDGSGFLVSSSDALGNRSTYTTDANGNVLTMTDPKGQTTAYTYDEVGRVTSVTSPMGNTTSYSYSTAGKLMSETDALGSTREHAYSGNGYITSEGDWNGNAIQYTYNVMNQKTAMTDGEGNSTTYSYDGLGAAFHGY